MRAIKLVCHAARVLAIAILPAFAMTACDSGPLEEGAEEIEDAADDIGDAAEEIGDEIGDLGN